MTNHGPGGPDRWQDLDSDPIVYVDQPEATSPRDRHDPWTLVLGILGGVLLGTGVTFAILGLTGVFQEPEPPPEPTIPPPPTLTVPPPTLAPPSVSDLGSATDIARRAIPSIVAVEISTLLGEGGGSGVVYGSDGYLITNHHVVEQADTVAVVFSDGARYDAEIIGSDPLTDIAVLRIDRPDLTPIDIGSSEGLTIGEPAVAVGNPLALVGGPSVTSGIVSALNRSLQVDSGTFLYGLVQTDAPITRGSSGGALLDRGARLIGITTAIAVADVGPEGLGFAVPIDLAIGVANDLIETGEVSHARLGIGVQTAFAQEGGAQYPAGVLVTELLDGSAYEAAGGQVNDVITGLDATPIRTDEELLTVMRRLRAGDEVVIGVTRADEDVELMATLGRREP